jgi:3-deoxy-D-arabino-heptulosonate 7-phosphate (DAHP) synthase
MKKNKVNFDWNKTIEYLNNINNFVNKNTMTKEKIIEIMENTESELFEIDGDNILMGLQILSNYTDGRVLQGADHDIIYGPDIDECIENGITEEDVTQLAKLNWILDSETDGFACFV